MAELPPITQPFRADVTQYVRTCRIIAKHLTALADELAALDSPFGPLSPILPVPVDNPGGPRPQPRRFQYHMGGPCPTPADDGTCGCAT